MVASLSSSDCFAAAIATPYTGWGSAGTGTMTGVPSGASVSPVRVSASLVTATMSPAVTVPTWVWSCRRRARRDGGAVPLLPSVC